MTETPENSNSEMPPAHQSATWPDSFLVRNKLRLIIGGMILLTAAGVMLYTRATAQANLNEEQAKIDRALMVETAPISARNSYQIHQKYSGRIVAGRESDHGFDKGGLLAEVLVDEGQRVKKGDILARLDMRRFDARAAELQADLAQNIALDQEAAAKLDQAQANYDRNKVLLAQKHISDQKFDQVKFDLIGQKAHKSATLSTVSRTRAALNSLSVEQDLATLTASYDGSVIRRYQDEGAALGAGAPVIRLIEDQKLEIHLGLPEAAISKLVPGETYRFDQEGHAIAAKLRGVHARLDPATRTVTAIFDIMESAAAIHAGGIAQLTLTHEIEAIGFWLPSNALAESRRGLWSVYTVKPLTGQNSATLGTVARQELQLIYTDSERVFVRGTLSDGDRIITGGLHRLVPGQLVNVAKGQ